MAAVQASKAFGRPCTGAQYFVRRLFFPLPSSLPASMYSTTSLSEAELPSVAGRRHALPEVSGASCCLTCVAMGTCGKGRVAYLSDVNWEDATFDIAVAICMAAAAFGAGGVEEEEERPVMVFVPSSIAAVSGLMAFDPVALHPVASPPPLPGVTRTDRCLNNTNTWVAPHNLRLMSDLSPVRGRRSSSRSRECPSPPPSRTGVCPPPRRQPKDLSPSPSPSPPRRRDYDEVMRCLM